MSHVSAHDQFRSNQTAYNSLTTIHDGVGEDYSDNGFFTSAKLGFIPALHDRIAAQLDNLAGVNDELDAGETKSHFFGKAAKYVGSILLNIATVILSLAETCLRLIANLILAPLDALLGDKIPFIRKCHSSVSGGWKVCLSTAIGAFGNLFKGLNPTSLGEPTTRPALTASRVFPLGNSFLDLGARTEMATDGAFQSMAHESQTEEFDGPPPSPRKAPRSSTAPLGSSAQSTATDSTRATTARLASAQPVVGTRNVRFARADTQQVQHHSFLGARGRPGGSPSYASVLSTRHPHSAQGPGHMMPGQHLSIKQQQMQQKMMMMQQMVPMIVADLKLPPAATPHIQQCMAQYPTAIPELMRVAMPMMTPDGTIPPGALEQLKPQLMAVVIKHQDFIAALVRPMLPMATGMIREKLSALTADQSGPGLRKLSADQLAAFSALMREKVDHTQQMFTFFPFLRGSTERCLAMVRSLLSQAEAGSVDLKAALGAYFKDEKTQPDAHGLTMLGIELFEAILPALAEFLATVDPATNFALLTAYAETLEASLQGPAAAGAAALPAPAATETAAPSPAAGAARRAAEAAEAAANIVGVGAALAGLQAGLVAAAGRGGDALNDALGALRVRLKSFSSASPQIILHGFGADSPEVRDIEALVSALAGALPRREQSKQRFIFNFAAITAALETLRPSQAGVAAAHAEMKPGSVEAIAQIRSSVLAILKATPVGTVLADTTEALALFLIRLVREPRQA